MGFYKYIREAWKKPKAGMKAEYQSRLMQYRREPATIRVERPTRLDRARSLGYKAKQGVIVVRQRVARGGRTKAKPSGGRRTKRASIRVPLKKNYQQVSEERVQRKYPNMEVVGSYLTAEDGKTYWYEVIMVDRQHKSPKNDPKLAGIASQKRRVTRGLTMAGRKSRGLTSKGLGAEKIRPSRSAYTKKKNSK
ncbi:MAG: 50S ribosomal protein L15e [Candidatus Woesearchaeota archaeon]